LSIPQQIVCDNVRHSDQQEMWLTSHKSELRQAGIWPGNVKALHVVIRVLLIVPFFVLSLIAPGTMPVSARDGGIRIVICAGHGPVEIIDNLNATSRPAHKNSNTPDPQTICGWSVIGHSAVPANFVTMIGPFEFYTMPFLKSAKAQCYLPRIVLLRSVRDPPYRPIAI